MNIFVALFLALPAFLFAQNDSSESFHSCMEQRYKLRIHYSKNDVPQKFQFMYRQPIEKNVDLQTIYPFESAIDFDGIVQFESHNGKREFRISYVNPGEIKNLEDMQLVPVNSLHGKFGYASVRNLWGTGSLFSRNNFYKEKWKAMRFLIPLFVRKNGERIVSGYACSDWQLLREVTEPKCKGLMSKQKKIKTKSVGTIACG